jgi:hypothetical protein
MAVSDAAIAPTRGALPSPSALFVLEVPSEDYAFEKCLEET